MKRHILTVVVLLAALACYAVGLDRGGAVFVAIGCGLEVWFWARVLNSARPAANPDANDEIG